LEESSGKGFAVSGNAIENKELEEILNEFYSLTPSKQNQVLRIMRMDDAKESDWNYGDLQNEMRIRELEKIAEKENKSILELSDDIITTVQKQ